MGSGESGPCLSARGRAVDGERVTVEQGEDLLNLVLERASLERAKEHLDPLVRHGLPAGGVQPLVLERGKSHGGDVSRPSSTRKSAV